VHAAGSLLWEFVVGSFNLLWKVFVIVIPIMVVLELFEGSRPFQALVRAWARVMGRLGMSKETATASLVGFMFGIAYGSGVIVRETRRHQIPRRQVFLMSVFLTQVHAIFEDTLVFVAVGASGLWLFGYRLAWAAAVTAAAAAATAAWTRRRRGRAGGAGE
jgi:hypothetical protein